jgi:hypothetical protein
MGLVTKPHTFTASTTALSSQVNANFDTLYTLVNGNIEAANIASGAVGEAELAASAVTNAKVSATAAIALSKLAALTATIVPITDANGVLSSSAVTPTELSYLTGVTSAIQTQLEAKQTAIDALINNGDTIYRGFVSSAGVGYGLPTGWTATRNGTGDYTVTHNLGLADARDLTITLTAHAAVGRNTSLDVFSRTVNSFVVSANEDDLPSDTAFSFIAIK